MVALVQLQPGEAVGRALEPQQAEVLVAAEPGHSGDSLRVAQWPLQRNIRLLASQKVIAARRILDIQFPLLNLSLGAKNGFG